MKLYDVVIVGGGVAALTAAIYSSRRNLNTVVVACDLGGQLATTDKVENYPGIDLISGPSLVEKFKKQGEKFGAEFLMAKAISVRWVTTGDSPWEECFEIITDCDEVLRGKTVILAFGLSPRELGIPHERELYHHGIFYSVADVPNGGRDQTIAVVGGGSSALANVLALAPVAKKIHLIHRRDSFRGEEALVEKLKAYENVVYHLSAHVIGVAGKDHLQAITIAPNNEKINVDALVVAIGYHAQSEWVREFVLCDDKGAIATNKFAETNMTGAFAAGDCTDCEYKQIPISSGEGATAAIRAYQYILKREGRRGGLTDWS